MDSTPNSSATGNPLVDPSGSPDQLWSEHLEREADSSQPSPKLTGMQPSLLDPVLVDEAQTRTVAERLDDLHQMLYTRGGIRPTNAAVEELSKLLLLKFALSTLGADYKLPSGTTLGVALDSEALRTNPSVDAVKEAFAAVVGLPAFAGRLPDGGTQSVWPIDEPRRITRADFRCLRFTQ